VELEIERTDANPNAIDVESAKEDIRLWVGRWLRELADKDRLSIRG